MMDPVELAGFVLSLAMVYCNIKEIHWGWPLAILSSALYGLVFWNSQLYGEASLQVMFILTALWGWHQWRKGTQSVNPDVQTVSPLKISQLNSIELKQAAAATLLAWPVMAYFLNRYTDSDVAIWDALVTTLSLLGQYLLAKKKIENWWVWLVVNIITVGLMLVKSLWLTALLYVLFAILSYIGLKAWRTQHGR
ncbi:MAG: nicotinamide mononucleotide transporter [Limnohabitans sp.]|jgi:nicotinamide mononucleotide transporter|nr:nicotinamide mononucleotide transporter [Limnohabitans sp.]